MARTAAQARTYLAFGGAIYLVLFVYGLIVGQESAANFVPVNAVDDFLHLVLGIGMVGLGLPLTRDRRGAGGATR
jgi:formate-dependent nitrite reductase membrane component NrfD